MEGKDASCLQKFEMNGDNLNMQNVIGDLKKSIRDKKSELRQSETRIADQERQLQNLDVSLKERTDENRYAK